MPSTTRGGARVGRFAGRGTLVLLLAMAASAFFAAPAGAHASLLESSPSAGAVLDAPPEDVTLTFSEPIDPRLGDAAVYDADGRSVDTVVARPPAPNVLRLRLPELDEGAYIVTWRVSGEDAHPVQGVFTFQVGAAANATGRDLTALAQELLTQGARSDQAVGALYGVSRWGVFAGLALLIGGTVCAVVVWPGGRTNRRARIVVITGWVLATVSTGAQLLLYGPYAKARPLGDLFDGGLIDDTLSIRSGAVWAIRLGLLVLALVPSRVVFSTRDHLPRGLLLAGAGLGVGLASTPGLAAHALVGDWVPAAVASQTLHVAAMATWLGALLVVACALLPGRTVAELREPLQRFSRLAFVSISVVVATGAFQSWRQVRSLEGLRTTEYGRILVVKLVIVGAVIALAAFSREYVVRLTGSEKKHPRGTSRARVPVVAGGADDARANDTAELRRLRWSVAGEALLAAVVLTASALLVNSPPARGVVERGTADVVTLTIEGEERSVDLTFSPGRAGRNDVHVSVLDADEDTIEVDQLTVVLTPPEGGTRITLEPEPLDDGHYLAAGQRLRPDGEWGVTVRVSLGGDDARFSDTVELR